MIALEAQANQLLQLEPDEKSGGDVIKGVATEE